MKTVEQTLEQLDNALDTVEELVRELPIGDKAKRELSDRVYTFWMDVEEAMINEQKEVDSTLI
jgi:uncharacterized protein YacL (UPF0231 family)